MSVQDLIDKYGTTGTVRIHGAELPIINIKMMDDDALRALINENAVSNYRRINGREPESVQEALKWQRERSAAKEMWSQ